MKIETPSYDALIDSDAFVGLIWRQDLLHQQAKSLFEHARTEQWTLATSSYVVMETATVLSSRSGQADARRFLALVEQIPTIHITESLQRDALELFKQQANKRTSVIDCANVILMRQFSIPRILSFDQFYGRQFGLKPAA